MKLNYLTLLPLLLGSCSSLSLDKNDQAAQQKKVQVAQKEALATVNAELPVVYFALDSYAITPDFSKKLDKFAATIEKSNVKAVEINGDASCDNNGSIPYNLSLSIRRANTVSEYLNSKIAASVKKSINIKGIGILSDTPKGINDEARRVKMQVSSTELSK